MLEYTENSASLRAMEEVLGSSIPDSPKRQEKTGGSQKHKTVDFILQGKGGCGKSLIASYLAQYLKETGESIRCYDADPVNNTLSGIETLCTEVIELLTEEETNVSEVDRVLSEILSADDNFLLDAGASGYVPLLSYMLRENLFDILYESRKIVRVHTVIIGGESLSDTVEALGDMIEQLPRCVRIYAWLNQFFGPLINNGCEFTESEFWIRTAAPIVGKFTIPKMSAAELITFRKLQAMRKTFEQSKTDTAFNAIERIRLQRIWKPIRDQIENSRIGL